MHHLSQTLLHGSWLSRTSDFFHRHLQHRALLSLTFESSPTSTTVRLGQSLSRPDRQRPRQHSRRGITTGRQTVTTSSQRRSSTYTSFNELRFMEHHPHEQHSHRHCLYRSHSKRDELDSSQCVQPLSNTISRSLFNLQHTSLQSPFTLPHDITLL